MTTTTVSSGTTSEGLTVQPGDRLVVLSGGRVTQTIVDSGGLMVLSSGGLASGVTVSAGAVLSGDGLLSGSATIDGAVAGVTIAGASQDIFTSVTLSSGASATGVTLEGGSGRLMWFLDHGAFETSATLLSGVFEELSGSAAHTVIESGGEQYMLSEGRSTDISVQSGGHEEQIGGVISGMTVGSGGFFGFVSGSALAVVVESGGSAEFLSAKISGDLTLGTGGVVVDAAKVNDTLFAAGAELSLAGSVSVLGDATLSIASGVLVSHVSVAVGATVSGAGSIDGDSKIAGRIVGLTQVENEGGDPDITEIVSGGVASAFTDAIGYAQIDAGGSSLNMTVGPYGETMISGVVSGARVSSGGVVFVDSGGSATGLTMSKGAVAYISSGATIADVTVAAAGLLNLWGGASASGVSVASGGRLNLAGVLDTDITLSSGSVLAKAITVDGATVAKGGLLGVVVATVGSGLALRLLSGAQAAGVTVLSGGLVDGPGMLTGSSFVAGTVSGVSVGDPVSQQAGTLVVTSGGVATGITVAGRYPSGRRTQAAVVSVALGAVASGMVVTNSASAYVRGRTDLDRISDGAIEDVISGGVAENLRIGSGGQGLATQALVSGAIVQSGGVLLGHAGAKALGEIDVEAGGVAGDFTIESTGVLLVGVGASAASNVLDAGAELIVRSGGSAAHTVISSGGREVVSVGAAESDAVLRGGGRIIDAGVLIFDAPTTVGGELFGSGVVVQAGAGVLVLGGDGISFHGSAVIGDGVIELGRLDALGRAGVAFTGSSTLQVDAPDGPKAGTVFANTLSNFSGAADRLDLAGIAFASGASAVVSGSRLVLTDGAASYAFSLAGSVAANYQVTKDRFGGVAITIADAPMAALLAQATASLPAGSAAALADASRSGRLAASQPVIAAAVNAHGT